MKNKLEREIQVAGTCLQLKIQSDTTNISINPCYSKFSPRHKKNRLFEVLVRHRYFERSSVDIYPKTVFHKDKINVISDGYSGTIDIEAKRAELDLKSDTLQEDIDYFLRVISALTVYLEGGFLFHAAGIRNNDKGFAFFGHSGSGKTTVCRLSKHAEILNDDLICMLPSLPRWKIFSTPFTNPTQVQPLNLTADLHGLFFLVQSSSNELRPMNKSRAISNILANIPIIPLNQELIPQLLSRIQKMVEVHHPKELLFQPVPTFWNLIDHDE